MEAGLSSGCVGKFRCSWAFLPITSKMVSVMWRHDKSPNFTMKSGKPCFLLTYFQTKSDQPEITNLGSLWITVHHHRTVSFSSEEKPRARSQRNISFLRSRMLGNVKIESATCQATLLAKSSLLFPQKMQWLQVSYQPGGSHSGHKSPVWTLMISYCSRAE